MNVCVVCGAPSWATTVIAGGIWAPYAVCWEHRHHDQRIFRSAASEPTTDHLVDAE